MFKSFFNFSNKNRVIDETSMAKKRKNNHINKNAKKDSNIKKKTKAKERSFSSLSGEYNHLKELGYPMSLKTFNSINEQTLNLMIEVAEIKSMLEEEYMFLNNKNIEILKTEHENLLFESEQSLIIVYLVRAFLNGIYNEEQGIFTLKDENLVSEKIESLVNFIINTMEGYSALDIIKKARDNDHILQLKGIPFEEADKTVSNLNIIGISDEDIDLAAIITSYRGLQLVIYNDEEILDNENSEYKSEIYNGYFENTLPKNIILPELEQILESIVKDNSRLQ